MSNAMFLRKINAMFHVDDEGYLIKTSNNERIPADEPLFILRGRDVLAVSTIHHYAGLLIGHNGDGDVGQRMFELGAVVADFMKFKTQHPERMKVPGVTRGK